MKLKILNQTTIPIKRANLGDAGYDLCSTEKYTLWPTERALIGTGVAIEIPNYLVGLVHPRSGLAIKYGITVLNAPGTVDSGYRGEIKVNLINLGDRQFTIEPGDRIAQLLIQRIEHPEMEIVHELSATDRGEKGHGSSG